MAEVNIGTVSGGGWFNPVDRNIPDEDIKGVALHLISIVQQLEKILKQCQSMDDVKQHASQLNDILEQASQLENTPSIQRALRNKPGVQEYFWGVRGDVLYMKQIISPDSAFTSNDLESWKEVAGILCRNLTTISRNIAD